MFTKVQSDPAATNHAQKPRSAATTSSNKRVKCCGKTFTFDDFLKHNSELHLNAAPSPKMGGLPLLKATVTGVLFSAPLHCDVAPSGPSSTSTLKSLAFLCHEMENDEPELCWTDSPCASQTGSLYTATQETEPNLFSMSDANLAMPVMGSTFDVSMFASADTDDTSQGWNAFSVSWDNLEQMMIGGYGFGGDSFERDSNYSTGGVVSTESLLHYAPSEVGSCGTVGDDAKAGRRKGKYVYTPSMKRKAAKDAQAITVMVAADKLRLSRVCVEGEPVVEPVVETPAKRRKSSTRLPKKRLLQLETPTSSNKKAHRDSFDECSSAASLRSFADSVITPQSSCSRNHSIPSSPTTKPRTFLQALTQSSSEKDSITTPAETPFMPDHRLVVGASPACAEAADSIFNSEAYSLQYRSTNSVDFPPLSTITADTTDADVLSNYMMMMGPSSPTPAASAMPMLDSDVQSMWADLLKFDGVDEEVGAVAAPASPNGTEVGDMCDFMVLPNMAQMLESWGGAAGPSGMGMTEYFAPLNDVGEASFLMETGEQMGIDTHMVLGGGGGGKSEIEVLSRSDSGVVVEPVEREDEVGREVGAGSEPVVGKSVFACDAPGCAKTYASKGGLTYHLKTHVKEERKARRAKSKLA
ncbi:hypothetical protein HDU98_011865 [Podochytrium sp. JEL0797]|nr:hypothetical protein HDU98_011865 [Podochytrium sp. JEL0797]